MNKISNVNQIECPYYEWQRNMDIRFLIFFVNFGPETWLMDDLDGPLTNNNVEGFHVRVNKWAKKAHPDLFGIEKTCQQLDADMSHKYKQRLNGKPASVLNKKVVNKYADLKRI